MSFLSRKSKLFGTNITPACSYCEYGTPSGDGAMILCSKKGIVSPYYSCKKYKYMPTKRIPKRSAKSKEFTESDFSLQ